jgi:hypothetical protein
LPQRKRVGSLSFTNHITLSVVEGESVQVNSASSMPLAPFEEKESRRDVNVRRKDKDNFIRFIGDLEIGSYCSVRF